MPKRRISSSPGSVDEEFKKAFSLPDLPPPSESSYSRVSNPVPSSNESAYSKVANFFSNPLAVFQPRQGNMAGFQYPGVNLPVNTSLRSGLDNSPPLYPIGMPDARGSISDILPIREVAMMLLMDQLTDKPNWHEKVFDEAIMQKWRQEARTQSENGLFSRIMEGTRHRENIPNPQSRIVSEEAFEFVRQIASLAIR